MCLANVHTCKQHRDNFECGTHNDPHHNLSKFIILYTYIYIKGWSKLPNGGFIFHLAGPPPGAGFQWTAACGQEGETNIPDKRWKSRRNLWFNRAICILFLHVFRILGVVNGCSIYSGSGISCPHPFRHGLLWKASAYDFQPLPGNDWKTRIKILSDLQRWLYNSFESAKKPTNSRYIHEHLDITAVSCFQLPVDQASSGEISEA